MTPQQEGGKHARGTDAKSYDQNSKMERERDTPPMDPDGERQAKGSDARDALTDRGNDLNENPGIGSSPGTTDSGESGIEDRDSGPGIATPS
ncbi:hypothetical protein [Azospirillum sp. sgz302134]